MLFLINKNKIRGSNKWLISPLDVVDDRAKVYIPHNAPTPVPQGTKGEDYINASLVQGFFSEKEFIITQYPIIARQRVSLAATSGPLMPLGSLGPPDKQQKSSGTVGHTSRSEKELPSNAPVNTLRDFWRMIYHHHFGLVVLFNSDRPATRDACKDGAFEVHPSEWHIFASRDALGSESKLPGGSGMVSPECSCMSEIAEFLLQSHNLVLKIGDEEVTVQLREQTRSLAPGQENPFDYLRRERDVQESHAQGAPIPMDAGIGPYQSHQSILTSATAPTSPAASEMARHGSKRKYSLGGKEKERNGHKHKEIGAIPSGHKEIGAIPSGHKEIGGIPSGHKEIGGIPSGHKEVDHISSEQKGVEMAGGRKGTDTILGGHKDMDTLLGGHKEKERTRPFSVDAQSLPAKGIVGTPSSAQAPIAPVGHSASGSRARDRFQVFEYDLLRKQDEKYTLRTRVLLVRECWPDLYMPKKEVDMPAKYLSPRLFDLLVLVRCAPFSVDTGTCPFQIPPLPFVCSSLTPDPLQC